MTKDQLKEHIATLHLEGELEQSIAHLIETAKEVDQKLLDTIADVLDLQAEFYEKTASLLEERAKTETAVQGSPPAQTDDHESSNGVVNTPTPEPVQTEPEPPNAPIPSENSPTVVPIASVPQVPPPGSEPTV